MKTIFIAASYSPSLVNFRGELIRELTLRGHVVHACAPRLLEDDKTSKWLETLGVKCHNIRLSRTGVNIFVDFYTLIALIRIIWRIRPDVFVGYTIKPVIWGIIASRVANVPRRVALITGLGYSFTGEASGYRSLIRKIVHKLYRISMKYCTLVFFQNPDDAAEFSRLHILSEDTPLVLINGSGVDIDHFNVAPLPEYPIRFLLIARLLGDKGIREYVAAAGLLSKRWPEAQFHIVGGVDPNPDGIAHAEADSWSNSTNIFWHGALPDVRASIAASHIYVLPSYREGTPRTVLEAMAMGRAIVTTDAPGCRETVQNGRNGFLVLPQDVASLQEAMERFLEEPSLIARMGEISRQIAEDKYDVKKVNIKIINSIGL